MLVYNLTTFELTELSVFTFLVLNACDRSKSIKKEKTKKVCLRSQIVTVMRDKDRTLKFAWIWPTFCVGPHLTLESLIKAQNYKKLSANI